MRDKGIYLPTVYEQVIEIQEAIVLSLEIALCLEALQNFTDIYGIQRKAGDQWL